MKENSKRATSFSFRKYCWSGFRCRKRTARLTKVVTKDFVTTKLKCLVFGVEATGLWGSRFTPHLVASNTQNVMVRMKFYKATHHKHVWWSRPMSFFERNPNPGTMQLSNIQKTLFFRELVRVIAPNMWHELWVRHQKPEFHWIFWKRGLVMETNCSCYCCNLSTCNDRNCGRLEQKFFLKWFFEATTHWLFNINCIANIKDHNSVWKIDKCGCNVNRLFSHRLKLQKTFSRENIERPKTFLEWRIRRCQCDERQTFHFLRKTKSKFRKVTRKCWYCDKQIVGTIDESQKKQFAAILNAENTRV